MEREGEAAETEIVTMEFLILAQLVTCKHIYCISYPFA